MVCVHISHLPADTGRQILHHNPVLRTHGRPIPEIFSKVKQLQTNKYTTGCKVHVSVSGLDGEVEES